MRVELDRRLAAMEAPKAETKPAAESAVAGKPDGIVAEKGSAAAAPVTPVKPAVASEPAKPVDLSFVDKRFRSVVENTSPEFQAYLREEYGDPSRLRTTDYTKKTTEVAEAKKALAAEKAAAELGSAIMSDQEALETLDALNKRRKGEKAPAPFDWDMATAEEREAHIEAVAEKKAKALREAERAQQTVQTQEAASVTAQRTEITNAAVEAFKSMGHEEKDFVSIVDPLFRKLGGWDGMAAIAASRGEEFSSDFVVATLKDFIPAPGKKPKDSPPENGARVNGAVGASALTRGSGTASPNNLPKHIKEGRVIRHDSPREDRIADALNEVNESRIARGLKPIATD